MRVRAVPGVTRRAALALLATLASPSLTGCDTGPARTGSTGAASGTPSPTPGPDLLLVQAALDATEAALARLRATGAREPGLRSATTSLTAMHRAHRHGFLAAGADLRSVPAAAQTRARTLRAVVALEAGLQRDLGRWALQAADGGVARLLATASAGVAQQLVTLRSGAT